MIRLERAAPKSPLSRLHAIGGLRIAADRVAAVGRIMLGLLPSAVIAGPVIGCALAGTPANPDPADVHKGRYTIETGHTRVLFAVSHMGFTTWYGNFTGTHGTLTLDPARPQSAALDVSVPVASISTTNTVLDGKLRGAAWLDTARFPEATFQSTRIIVTSAGHADVLGILTLHGVSRPLTLQASFNGAGVNPLDLAYTAGFEADGVIRRSDYGITTYVPLIGDEVRLIISAAFEHR